MFFIPAATCDQFADSNDEHWIDANSVDLGCIGFFNTTTTFSEAETKCASKNAHLVEIFGRDQLDFLKEKAKAQKVSFSKSKMNWWLGIKFREYEGIWYWRYSNTKVVFTNWRENHINYGDGNGGETNAIALDDNFGWDNEDNSRDDTYPICQFEL